MSFVLEGGKFISTNTDMHMVCSENVPAIFHKISTIMSSYTAHELRLLYSSRFSCKKQTLWACLNRKKFKAGNWVVWIPVEGSGLSFHDWLPRKHQRTGLPKELHPLPWPASGRRFLQLRDWKLLLNLVLAHSASAAIHG